MRIHLRGILAATTAIGLVVSAGAASAQEAEVEAGEIIVTAQKRTENLQDVPISISVVSGENLRTQGAASLVDYGGYVPGLTVLSSQPGTSTISLRGIAPVGSAQSVGIYLDDAPVGSSSLYARSATYSLDLMPYDIQGIEVLRGPQGTFYGASSIGGLLKYVTVKPSLEKFSFKAGGELFAINHAGNPGWATQAMANIPIVEGKLGMTASFAWRKTPGYTDTINNPDLKDQNDIEQTGGRLSLLWEPSDVLSVRLGGIWQSIRAEGTNTVTADVAGVPDGNGWSNNNFVQEPFRKSIDYYSAAIDYDVDFATLSSATTYSETNTHSVQDASLVFGIIYPFLDPDVPAGLAPFILDLGLEKFTQEIRLTSPSGGMFEWMIGGFYTKEDSSNHQIVRTLNFDGTPNVFDPGGVVSLPSTFKEYAIFGNATLRFGNFDISGGVRWAQNKQKFRQISDGPFIGFADDPGASKEDVFIYSISPQFHLNDDAMVYARVANGYRPGGPNVTFPGVPAQVDADTLVNYEVGFKANLFDRSLSVDVAAFYMDWKDIQIIQDFGGVTGQTNGPKAVSKGIEGSISWRPLAGLTLGLNGAYTDATFGADAPEINAIDGDRLQNVPKFSGSFSADYNFAISDRLEGKIGGGVRRMGQILSAASSAPDALWSDAYTAVDLNAAVTVDEHWTVRLYARNLLDKEAATIRQYVRNAFNIPAYQSVTPLQPRTVGVALDLSF
jgi:outer membrane receptor protein involved in Fe transport